MRTIIQLLFLAGLLSLSGCKQAPPTEGKWRYNHERTKEKIAKMYAGKDLLRSAAEKSGVPFKEHPPMLELHEDGSFEMHRLLKTSGYFSGKFRQKGNRLFLYNDEGGDLRTVDYDKQRDEYILAFVLYPIVLSREK